MADFAEEVRSLSGVDLKLCYQCRKCSNACPVAAAMDLHPARLTRAVLADEREKVLSSKAIWLCTSCLACSARCPRSVDFARVVDSLRALVVREGRRGAAKRIETFHRTFVAQIKKNGRINETALVCRCKLLSGEVLKNLDRGLALFFRGKFPLFGGKVKDAASLRRAFEREETAGGDQR